MTRRKEISMLLRQRAWTPKELASHFFAEMSEIIADLEHVRRSTQLPLRFRFSPPFCRQCGFVFKERLKLKAPTKCPKCRSEGIEEGRYSISQGE